MLGVVCLSSSGISLNKEEKKKKADKLGKVEFAPRDINKSSGLLKQTVLRCFRKGLGSLARFLWGRTVAPIARIWAVSMV